MAETKPALKPEKKRTVRRIDIDGLRGLAIALVVVFHVFVGRVSAGVDVFLLLGGIFFFAPQIRNVLNPAGLTVVQSFLRILRRLYPALVTVVTVSLVAALVVYAPVRWSDAGEDAAASLLYVQNLNLTRQGDDYAAISADVSLFQHIWSMSVQMQVYLGSLLVIALLGSMYRRWPRVGTALLRVLLLIGTVASFCYGVWLGGVDQGANYYSPLSRFWEIGLGGLFGMAVLGRTLPAAWARLRWPAGVLGLVLIVATGLLLDGAAQFPGPWTLVPLAGAMLVVLAGNPVAERDAATSQDAATTRYTTSGVTALLRTAPLQFLGRTAYGLYLWHWPLLTLATFLATDTTQAAAEETGAEASDAGLQGITATLGMGTGAAVGAGVIAASVVLAWLTLRFIEVPLQQSARPPRSFVLGDHAYLRAALRSRGKTTAAMVIVAASVAVMAFGPLVERYNEDRATTLATEPVDPRDYPGPAAYLEDAPVPDGLDVVPGTTEVDPMMPQTQDDGCYSGFDETGLVLTREFNESDEPCAYGDVDSTRTMYLAGGSHSEHYLPALDRIAAERGIRVVPLVKMGCVLGEPLTRDTGEAYPECAQWQVAAEQYILDNPPTDGVFMTSTRPTTIAGDGPDQVPQGYVDVVSRFTAAGIHTWGVRDTPWLMAEQGTQLNGRLCVAEDGDKGDTGTSDCAVAQDEALAASNPATSALAGLDVTHLDLTAAVCRDGQCPAVVGNVLVYRDSQHLSNRFAGMLAPEITRQMFGA
ncbi:MAG: acyltransferase family protein [Corynebacterium sp.]|uniref:acyltransferase family protein n=1 Tax=Corynebacterium sp. TaxID=1720 RepID=UPI003F90BC24